MRRQVLVIAAAAVFAAGVVGAGVSYAVTPEAQVQSQRAAKPVVHEVGAPGEVPYKHRFSLEFMAYNGAPFGNLSFFKDASGVVHLTGLTCVEGGGGQCYSNTQGGGTWKIFTLPKGFRPGAEQVFTTLSAGQGNYYHARVDITRQGAVLLVCPPVAGLEWISFDGVSFLSK